MSSLFTELKNFSSSSSGARQGTWLCCWIFKSSFQRCLSDLEAYVPSSEVSYVYAKSHLIGGRRVICFCGVWAGFFKKKIKFPAEPVDFLLIQIAIAQKLKVLTRTGGLESFRGINSPPTIHMNRQQPSQIKSENSAQYLKILGHPEDTAGSCDLLHSDVWMNNSQNFLQRPGVCLHCTSLF